MRAERIELSRDGGGRGLHRHAADGKGHSGQNNLFWIIGVPSWAFLHFFMLLLLASAPPAPTAGAHVPALQWNNIGVSQIARFKVQPARRPF